jgi:hypothetical protein
MTITVELPDGRKIEFPDDTAPETMRSAAKKAMGQPDGVDRPAASPSMASEADIPHADAGMASNILDSFTQGAALGFGDELTAVEAAILGRSPGGGALDLFDYSKPFAERYEAALEAERTQNEAFKSDYPNLSTGVEIAGAMASPLTKALPLSGSGQTMGRAVAKGAAEGGALGAVYGFGSGEGTGGRLEGAAYGAALGAPAGAVTGAVGSALSTKSVKAPTTEALKAESGAAYDAAANAGVIINRNSWRQFGERVRRKMAEEGIDETIHPKAMAALGRVLSVDQNITLKGADILRRVVRNVARSNDPSERRLAALMLEQIDDYISAIKPADLVMGDAKGGVQALQQARALWSRVRKADTIEAALESAKLRASQFTGSGYENALRTEFRQIARNQKMMRTFSGEERKAIRAVAMGGPVANSLRLLGKLAPTGIVSGAGSAYLGGLIGGPVGSAVTIGTGIAARKGAEAMTARAAERALATMRQGGPLLLQRSLTPTEELMLHTLMVGGALGPQAALPRPPTSTDR